MNRCNIGIGIDTEHEEGGIHGRSLVITNNAEAQQTLTRKEERLTSLYTQEKPVDTSSSGEGWQIERAGGIGCTKAGEGRKGWGL